MTVLKCNDENCKSVVESNKCCGAPMKLEGEQLKCASCGKEVSVNNCCGAPMKERKE